MPVYKDTKKGTWYTSFHYVDWTGTNRRKLKRGFPTKKRSPGMGEQLLINKGF